MTTPETKLPLKFLVDSKLNKVIFAEAGNDLVVVSLSFLTLPLGTIIRRLKQHFGGNTNALGCLNYNPVHATPSNECITVSIIEAESIALAICISMEEYSPGLNFVLIQNLASDVDEFEEKTIMVGLNEIMHLLKLSLFSPAPLTNFLFLYLKSDHLEQSNFGTLAPNHKIAHQTEDSRTMVIKALVQKSTNKLLFFLARDDFVGFIFRLLSIPLGSVASLLCVNTPHGSIDNLYSSTEKLSSEYLESPKECLLNPKVIVYLTNSLMSLSSNLNGTSGLDLMDLIYAKRLLKETSTVMFTDDLIVTPLTPTSISHLQSCKIPVSDNIGSKESLDILKEALTSSTSVLSNALLLMKQPKEEKQAIIDSSFFLK